MIDILTIRDRLNELPFQQGQRQTFIGRVSDNVQIQEGEAAEEEQESTQVCEDSPEAIEYLRTVERELGAHDLQLARGDDDPDALYAIQLLRAGSDVDLTWMAEGMKWVSRITTVALEMVIPVILGTWLDHYFGTKFLALLGVLLGMPIGLWHLIQLTRRRSNEIGS